MDPNHPTARTLGPHTSLEKTFSLVGCRSCPTKCNYKIVGVAEKSCQPTVEGSRATFLLKLGDIYQCMLTKVLNKLTVGAQLIIKELTGLRAKGLTASLNLE